MLRALVLLLLFISSTVHAQQPQALTFDHPQSITLSDEQATVTFSFDAQAEQIIYVAALAVDDNLETDMTLFGANGTELLRQPGYGSSTILGPITLTNSGSYTLELSRASYYAGTTGEISITVGEAVLETIKADGTYSDRLDFPGDVAFFEYFAAAQDLFGYSAEGSALTFALRSPAGDVVAASSDQDSFADPLNFLSTEGIYTGYLLTTNPAGTDYSFNVLPLDLRTMIPGETLSGSFDEIHAPVFSFDSDAETVWSINATFDDNAGVWMQIYNADDPSRYLVEDYGSGPDGSLRIDPFVAPDTGTYYVVLRANDYQPRLRRYNYEIVLNESALRALVPGETVTGSVTPEEGQVVFTYQGALDELIELSLRKDGGEGSPAITLQSPSDELAYFYVQGGLRVRFDVVLPETGLYFVVVDNESYEENTSLDFSLTLSYPK